MVDCYELLQISPNADNDTIHRVYKYLAARLHPDNLQTGDAAKFQRVKTAYDVLSNAQRRREYDAKRRELITASPLSSSIDFMDHLDGETNRRMAILAVLYYRRRTSPNFPDVPLARHRGAHGISQGLSRLCLVVPGEEEICLRGPITLALRSLPRGSTLLSTNERFFPF